MSAGLAACSIIPIWKTQKWTYMVFRGCSARGAGNCTWILPLIYQGGGLDDCGIEHVLLWFVLCSSSKDLTVMARHTYVRQKEASQAVFCMYLISNCDKAAKGRYNLPVVWDVFVKKKKKDPEQTFQKKRKEEESTQLSYLKRWPWHLGSKQSKLQSSKTNRCDSCWCERIFSTRQTTTKRSPPCKEKPFF